MNIRYMLAPLVIAMASCSTYSAFERFEPKSKGLDKAALLLEGNDPKAAQSELLKLVPTPARVLLETSDMPPLGSYVTDLAASMRGVGQGANILSMYATAEAAATGVGTLNIIVELVKVDKNKKQGSSLLLTQSEQEAISIFFPAMPPSCAAVSALVQKNLDKSIAIILATGILRGFPPEDIENRWRELRASLSKSDLLNQSIFSLVNFICPILEFDTSRDFVVDESEARNISDQAAQDLYARMEHAIASIQAMVDANPGDQNLEKALARCKMYKDKIDAMPAEISLADKVRSFLVSQTKLSP